MSKKVPNGASGRKARRIFFERTSDHFSNQNLPGLEDLAGLTTELCENGTKNNKQSRKYQFIPLVTLSVVEGLIAKQSMLRLCSALL
jgi:hypothetical protein